MSLPEEYQNVLVYRKDGTPVIAHRNRSRWYGYTLLEWLDFEPDVWTHLEQIDALRAELAHKDAVIAAQKELLKVLEGWKESDPACPDEWASHFGDYRKAKAKLAELGEA